MNNPLSNEARDIVRGVATTTDRALNAGRHAALDAMDSLRSHNRQLRHVLQDSRDGALRYVRHEPGKTVMIAAAAGVVVLGLALLTAHLRHRD